MPRQSLGDRIYRWLLRIFPAEFRGDFGSDMLADFETSALTRVGWVV
jgi:hypothetical protein